MHKKKEMYKKKKKCKGLRDDLTVRELFFILIGGSVLTIGLCLLVISIVAMYGFSMVPTLHDGDKVLLLKNSELGRFDLVAFTGGDGKTQIRRVIGLPEESLHYKDDILYINDQPIDEKFLVESINESKKNGRNFTENFSQQISVIPNGYYFVLGDNRPYATDSRHYGLVSEDRILGKVKTQLYPFNEVKEF